MAQPLPNISRHSLRLQIDPHTSTSQHFSPKLNGVGSSTTSPRSPSENWSFQSPSGTIYERICAVRGLYDFDSSDPDHLSFGQGDILHIIKQEDNGWWAAARDGGVEVGWIPASYVRVLSGEFNTKDDLLPNPHPLSSSNNASMAMKSSVMNSFGSPGSGFIDDEALNTARVVSWCLWPDFSGLMLT